MCLHCCGVSDSASIKTLLICVPPDVVVQKKKRGALRGPLHKLGKEFKKVFT